MYGELLDKVTAALIERGQKSSSGYILILDEHNIKRVIQETVSAHAKELQEKQLHMGIGHLRSK